MTQNWTASTKASKKLNIKTGNKKKLYTTITHLTMNAWFLLPRDQPPSTGEEEVEKGTDKENIAN